MDIKQAHLDENPRLRDIPSNVRAFEKRQIPQKVCRSARMLATSIALACSESRKEALILKSEGRNPNPKI
jgi:hypothetical protein